MQNLAGTGLGFVNAEIVEQRVAAGYRHIVTGGLRRLLDELVSRAEQALSEVEEDDPIEATARVVGTLATLFAEDEDFCRAALRAGQGLERSGSNNGALRIWQRSAQVAKRICLDASEAGLLRGDCDPERIGERAYDSYRIAAIDWLDGVIDVAEFERNALIGFYLCLAADAVPRFRRALMSRIAEVESDGPRAKARVSRSRA